MNSQLHYKDSHPQLKQSKTEDYTTILLQASIYNARVDNTASKNKSIKY